MDEHSQATQPVPADLFGGSGETRAGAASQENAGCWGTLVGHRRTLPLIKNEYWLGRHRNCDITFAELQISNHHCRVFRSVVNGIGDTGAGASGGAANGSSSASASSSSSASNSSATAATTVTFIEDRSSNGTLVNGQPLKKGAWRELHDRDEISLPGKKPALTPHEHFFIYKERGRNVMDGQMTEEQEIMETSGYHITKIVLGVGQFATVKLAFDRETGEKFAVKILDKKKFWKPQHLNNFEQEINVLKSVLHPNIIRLYDVFDTKNYIYLFLQFAPGGELFYQIQRNKRIPEEDCKFYFYQMLQAVKYLHERGIAHRDIKPENLLLCEDKVLLADFGLAKVVNHDSFMKTLCGTPFYVAPEVLANAEKRGYDHSVDCWSLGVCLFTMLSGTLPFSEGENDADLVNQIKTGKFGFHASIWEQISPEAKDLVSKLIVVNPAKRYTVSESLAHAWLQDPRLAEKYEKFIEHANKSDISDNTKASLKLLESISSKSKKRDSADLLNLDFPVKPVVGGLVASSAPLAPPLAPSSSSSAAAASLPAPAPLATTGNPNSSGAMASHVNDGPRKKQRTENFPAPLLPEQSAQGSVSAAAAAGEPRQKRLRSDSFTSLL